MIARPRRSTSCSNALTVRMGRKIWPSAFDAGGETAPTPGWSSATGGRSDTGRRYHASRSRGRTARRSRVAYPGRPMSIDTDLARAVRAAVARRREQRRLRRDPRAGRLRRRAICAPRTPRRSASSRARRSARRSRCRWARCRRPSWRPDEVLIATFASSVNYNTVWSAIFEPVPTFAFLKRLAKTHGYGQPARPADARRRLGRLRRRAAHGRGGQPLEARRSRARAPQLRRARGAAGPRRRDPRSRPARVGLRVQLRRHGRAVRGARRPADAEARAPDMGRGGLDAARRTARPTACSCRRTAPTCSRATSC